MVMEQLDNVHKQPIIDTLSTKEFLDRYDAFRLTVMPLEKKLRQAEINDSLYKDEVTDLAREMFGIESSTNGRPISDVKFKKFLNIRSRFERAYYQEYDIGAEEFFSDVKILLKSTFGNLPSKHGDLALELD